MSQKLSSFLAKHMQEPLLIRVSKIQPLMTDEKIPIEMYCTDFSLLGDELYEITFRATPLREKP